MNGANTDHSSICSAVLVAAAHPALGGDEEDGRPEIGGAQPYQLHRDTQTVSCSGMYCDRTARPIIELASLSCIMYILLNMFFINNLKKTEHDKIISSHRPTRITPSYLLQYAYFL